MKLKLHRLLKYAMRLSFIGVFLQCLFLNLLIASSSDAQRYVSVKDVVINIDVNGASLEQLFDELEQKTDFQFTYDNNVVAKSKTRFSISGKRKSVEEILLQISKQAKLRFKQVNNNINVNPLRNEAKDKSIEIVIQGVTITGKVTSSEDDQGLPGVNVIVKGTSHGTVTDVDGNYSLEVQGEASVLVFSSVGYVQEEITVALQKVINISMVPDIKALEEIVVIGYGTAKKSDLTGALSSIRSESFENHPMNDFAQILQGRAPGITVSNSSGSPGQAAKIRIRGANSISGGNDPLYVVDGFITDFEMLNIFDIESIEILKDASATAIYGSRGANGVIMITTKEGRSESPKVKLSSNIGISQMGNRYDLLNAEEYAGFINDYYDKDAFSQEDLDKFRNGYGTDWQDELFQTGMSQNYQASVSGGTGKMNYYISGNYIDEKGTLINTYRKKYSFRGNFNFDINDRLSLGMNMNATKNDKKNPHLSTSGSKKSAVIWETLIWSPTEPIFNEDGSYNQTDKYGSVNRNPYLYAKESLENERSQSVILNANLRYELFDDLTLNVIAGAEKGALEERSFKNKYLENQTEAQRTYDDLLNWQVTGTITYDKTFNDSHNLNAVGGYEMSEFVSNYFEAFGKDLGVSSVGYNNLSLATSQTISSGYIKSSLLSYFTRANYNYKSKYFFTGTWRADGSSKFAEGNKWGYFPSFALSWRASEEPFVKNLGIFDNLKVRGSWGITGNQAIDPYATFSSLAGAGYSYTTSTYYPGYTPSIPASTNLKWEETEQFNIGLDFGFMDNRLSFSFEYFRKNTTDLLTERLIPSYSGFGDDASITQNLGEIENKGFEADINIVPILKADFSWDINLNFSTLKNEVISIGDQERIFGGTYGSGIMEASPFVIMPGYALGSFWGYKFLGIWSSSEQEEALKYGCQPGDSKYEDVDGDYTIGAADYQVIGDANPDFTWGLNSQFRYKNFELNILLQGVHGRDVLNLTYASAATITGDTRSITLKEAADYWTPQNENTIWPNIKSSTNRDYLNSSKWIQNGSFVKLNNVSLAYTIPRNAAKIGDIKLLVSGQNLLTFTNYKGFDPEVSSTGELDTDSGLDFGVYPLPKIITLGVALDF
ncbi:MAG: SusC/RagA family TonB-linked outer membrane protein [Cytophagales bacterium]|nr:SusC/RagA family TonB-linked outer membrane protein [Cytophagales bacterium]